MGVSLEQGFPNIFFWITDYLLRGFDLTVHPNMKRYILSVLMELE
jgi:hypothetical protein